jgi:hypothetical protein
MLWWFMAGVGSTGHVCDGATYVDACKAGATVGTGLAIGMLFMLWFIGFVVGAIVWFATRPRNDTVVYGPEGQQAIVSEKEARRRVADGWTYQLTGGSPTSPPAAS